jgi:hypothetical protein
MLNEIESIDDPVSDAFIANATLTSLVKKKINLPKRHLAFIIINWYDQLDIHQRNEVKILIKTYKNDMINFQKNGIQYPSLNMFPYMDQFINILISEIK